MKRFVLGLLLSLALMPASARGAKVDFLWVIDNSPSMAGEQEALSSVAADIAHQFESAMCPIDWRMAVAYTDAHLPPTVDDVCPGAPGPGRRRVCPFTRDIDVFRNGTPECAYVKAGTCGDGSERGFSAARIAIDEFQAQSGCEPVEGAECDLRSDARLAIIFFTDTGEQTSSKEPPPGQPDGSVASWVRYFNDFDLFADGPQRAQVHGILCPNRPGSGDTTGPCSDGLANPALYQRYSDVITQMGGTEGSIEDDDHSHLPATIQNIVNAAIAGACCGNGHVEPGEQCDDGNLTDGDCCSSSCEFEPAATVCRAAIDSCDVAEFCTGTTASCPADGFQASGFSCRGAVGPCDEAEACSGTTPTCPPDALKPSTFECRTARGTCDFTETCTGTGPFCPVDVKKPSGAECRSSGGVCDPAEFCNGVNPLCPTDGKSTTVCRSSAGSCDVAESCDGHTNDCPADAFKATTVRCRAEAGTCDTAEYCTGTDGACPTDAFKAATVQCRAAVGVCDAAELCGGASADCPADQNKSAGTICRAAAGACDAAEVCDGSSTTCPLDEYQAPGVECRAAAGGCDVAEVCTGSSLDCPADVLQPANFECRPVAGDCDLAERCTGRTAACPDDRKRLSVCRPSTSSCDLPEQCDGVANDCPADRHSPDGMTCDDTDACTAQGSCAAGACVASTPVDCDDHDACTTDTCESMVGCTHTPLQGFASLTCRCASGLRAPTCSSQPVPKGVGKQFARACRLIERARTLKPKKARKLMKKAVQSLKVAGKIATKAKKRKKISAACAGALSGSVSDLQLHTQQNVR